MGFGSGRYFLRLHASIWRLLMRIGMFLHHRAPLLTPPPSFRIKIPTRLSRKAGSINLVFYVPDGYQTAQEGYRYPLVINFHGGGFTLGTGTDDARWARSVVNNVGAVLVSVEYRLAPKYPFSIGVEDGTDALIYLAAHADELRLDPHHIILSGFSSGANLALAIPFLLYDLRNGTGRHSLSSISSDRFEQSDFERSRTSSIALSEAYNMSSQNIPLLTRLRTTDLETSQQIPPLTLRGIVSFYPPTDFRIPRAAKRASNSRPEFNLSSILTDLFDEAYLSPAHTTTSLDLSDPYLSPAAATDELLRAAYPQLIILYTCEHDMLNAEGVAFAKRLKTPEVGKTVKGGLIKNVPHAFDKIPNPMKYPEVAERCYAEVCAELNNDALCRRERLADRTQLSNILDVARFENLSADHNGDSRIPID